MIETPSRRAFLASAAFAALSPRVFAGEPHHEPFDTLMAAFLLENKVPGAALAVTRLGKVVYSRGFGVADRDRKEPVKADSLFRIASVSKPITAVAVMQLVEQGKLKLDDRVLDRMPLKPVAGAKFDDRWKQVTVRHCLHHTGGWDRDKSFDPIGRAWAIAKALEVQPPVTPEHVVRYMLGRPLDFAPGERYAYSNLGYLVLGRIIEALTGQKYEAYVKKNVFAPLGVTAAHLGRARVADLAKNEVRYHDAKNGTGRSLFPPLGETVPTVYGAMNLEAFEAHGGWVASAVDLVKFAAAFDDPAKCPLLGAKAIAQMWARPDGAAGTDANGKPRDVYYACGWQVRPVAAGKANHWHGGYIPGTEALLVRRHDGLNWAVLFNANDTPDGKSLGGRIDGKVHEAANAVKAWPG